MLHLTARIMTSNISMFMLGLMKPVKEQQMVRQAINYMQKCGKILHCPVK